MQVSFPISAFGCKLALTGSEIVIPKVFTGGVPKGVQNLVVIWTACTPSSPWRESVTT